MRVLQGWGEVCKGEPVGTGQLKLGWSSGVQARQQRKAAAEAAAAAPSRKASLHETCSRCHHSNFTNIIASTHTATRLVVSRAASEDFPTHAPNINSQPAVHAQLRALEHPRYLLLRDAV
jgi:hypothetical protein